MIKKRTLITSTPRFRKAFSEGDENFRKRLSRRTNETSVTYSIRINNLLRSKKEKAILKRRK